jgi:isopenicillin N synthase-like dioxygenase
VNILINSFKLLQASPHRGLQVQNLSGEWIDAPPIPGTFVINIGRGMSPASCSRYIVNHLMAYCFIAFEFVTRGVARATSHRVLSPRGDTPRFSVPFFQNISLTTTLVDKVLNCTCVRTHVPLLNLELCNSPS